MSDRRPTAVIVLAAGEGTRMKSTTPKVLHTIGGRSLVSHAMRAGRGAEPAHLAVVVRHERDRVAEHVTALDPDVVLADQDEVKGTGRAVECALEALPADLSGTVVVTYGDVPLLTSATITDLVEQHVDAGGAITIVIATLTDPTGYGRIVRGADGGVEAVVEQKDATPEQRAITEVNSGIYAFDAALLREALAEVGTDNAQGEKYLTDVVAVARSKGHRVRAHAVADLWQTEGVNDKVQLARLGVELNRRTVEQAMRDGAIVIDPATTWIDADVTIGQDTVLHPGTQLHGATTVGRDCTIGPDTTLVDTEVGDGASVVRTQAQLAVDRRRRRGRTLLLPPSRHGPRRGGQDRRLRRDEERADRSRRQAAPPQLLRGRHDRRGRQHRGGHDLRQLRRRSPRAARPSVRRASSAATR